MINKNEDYVKFEVEYFLDEDGDYCYKRKVIEISKRISEGFLDDLWDNNSINENELKLQKEIDE